MLQLTGNQLKIIAMVAMTVDHVGMVLFPQYRILRILGRLAMPIYAYMIAEGCRYTHDPKKYLLRLLGLGLACQVVYFFAMGSLYQCILITFSLSVMVIYSLDWAKKQGSFPTFLVAIAAACTVWLLCEFLPTLLPGTDFAIDYNFFGVFLPVLVWLGKTKKHRLLLFSAGLILLSLDCGNLQWFCLATIPLLALYNGQRGRANIGKLFYFYYPAHLVIIHGISLIL